MMGTMMGPPSHQHNGAPLSSTPSAAALSTPAKRPSATPRTTAAGAPVGRTPRLVRQTPLLQRIINAPSDAYLQSHEWLSLVNWDDYYAKAGNAIGIALNLAYLVIKALRGDAFADDELFVEPKPTSKVFGLFAFFTTSRLFEVALIVASVANAVALFNNSKSYTLFDQPTEPPPMHPEDTSWIVKSRNARLVVMDLNRRLPLPRGGGRPSSSASDFADDDDTDDDDLDHNSSDGGGGGGGDNDDRTATFRLRKRRFPATPTPSHRGKGRGGGGGLWSAWSPFTAWSKKGKGKRRLASAAAAPRGPQLEKRWVLKVWHPPIGCTRVFCWFSPASVLILSSISRENWLFMIFLAAFVDLMVFFMIQVFMDRLQDQEILHSQLAREYNKNFVYKLPPFRRTQAVAVGGDEPWETNDEGTH
ncbi:hypothetical protein DFJ73DRAFT_824110 [Zopfochytrium polystomum]|nr:hypothetical protein DFJ73DRAFT_824110 [Zopfochytrium polystomum]